MLKRGVGNIQVSKDVENISGDEQTKCLNVFWSHLQRAELTLNNKQTPVRLLTGECSGGSS